MPVAAPSLEQLGPLVGTAYLRTDAASCEGFRVDGVAPAAVVEPGDAKELVEIVRWARAHRAALLPATSGAYLPVGNPPAALDVAVSLRRLHRVLHHDPGDLTLSVQAGTPLASVQALLGGHRQFLPADPPYAERPAPAFGAALGGLLATNISGPLRYAYGTWRDFVVGLQFITGEGKLVKTGGRVVKNVAGYDLSKLLIGSLGTLGILTEVNFKVFPLPAQTATFVAGFDDPAAALEMGSRIVHSAWQPTAIELLDPAAAGLADTPPLSPGYWSLVVSVAGVEKVIRRYEPDLSRLAWEQKAAYFAVLRDESEQALWEAARHLVVRAREANLAATIVKCALPLTQVGAFLTKAQQVAARYELPVAASAHAGSGIAYIYLMPALRSPLALSGGEGEGVGGPAHRSLGEGGTPPDKRDAAKSLAQAATEMIHAGNNLGGRVTVPWCPTEVKRDVNVWGPLRDDFPLMQKLKAQFDPDRILNPGRFVGGL